MRWMSRLNVLVYRLSGGALWGKWRVGAAWEKPVPVCLLTTTGKKTGIARTAPLLFLEDGQNVLLVASQGGMRKNPLWYVNLKANPEVTIQIKRRVGRYRSRIATPEERERYWPRLVEHYADFATYQRWTDRVIPVVVCEPIA